MSRWWGAYRKALRMNNTRAAQAGPAALAEILTRWAKWRSIKPAGPDWRSKELEVFILIGVSDEVHTLILHLQFLRQPEEIKLFTSSAMCRDACPPRGSEQPCAGGGCWGTEGHFCLSEVRDSDRLNSTSACSQEPVQGQVASRGYLSFRSGKFHWIISFHYSAYSVLPLWNCHLDVGHPGLVIWFFCFCFFSLSDSFSSFCHYVLVSRRFSWLFIFQLYYWIFYFYFSILIWKSSFQFFACLLKYRDFILYLFCGYNFLKLSLFFSLVCFHFLSLIFLLPKMLFPLNLCMTGLFPSLRSHSVSFLTDPFGYCSTYLKVLVYSSVVSLLHNIT